MLDNLPLDTVMIAVGAAVAMAVLGLALMSVFSGSRATQRRMARVTARARGSGGAEAAVKRSVRRDIAPGRFAGLDSIAARILPRPGQLRLRLEKSGMKITVGQYFLANLLIGVIAGYLLLTAVGIPLVAVAGGFAIGLGLPHMFISTLLKRRKSKFLGQFPEAIDLIVRGLKSGLPVSDSLGVVAQELQDPVRSDFRTVTELMSVGKSLDDALWEMAERLEIPEFNFFVVALSVQRETGGNLAETLENLADILRRRRQMKLKIKALSSEAKASAIIIGSLPFIMFAIIYAMSPKYEQALLDDPRGIVMICVGIFWLLCGVGAMAKMVNFEI